MSMTWEQIAIAALGAVVELSALFLAFRLGWHGGYWCRVEEEKSARGIK